MSIPLVKLPSSLIVTSSYFETCNSTLTKERLKTKFVVSTGVPYAPRRSIVSLS